MSSSTYTSLNSSRGEFKMHATPHKPKSKHWNSSTSIVVFLLLSFIGLGPSLSDYSVGAIPVEEDPQSFSSGANDGLSFSINSPRKTDAADQRNTQDQRSQQQRASNGDRKGIKVIRQMIKSVLLICKQEADTFIKTSCSSVF